MIAFIYLALTLDLFFLARMFENERLSVTEDEKLCLNKVAQSFDLL